MSHSADFGAAHLRHWQDAELLFQHDRWANADQLYGLSAECGLKAVMRSSGMRIGRHGAPIEREYRKHLPQLWLAFTAFVRDRIGGRYLSMLPASNPFTRWSIGDRYADGRHCTDAWVRPHRLAARDVRRMVQSAQQDGVL